MKMSDDEFEVEDIVTSRIRSNKTQYLVRWKGFGPDSDTWEPAKNLVNCTEILERFKKSQEVKNYAAPDLKRSHIRSRSRSRSRGRTNDVNKIQTRIKPVEVMINGIAQAEPHSVVAELVKSSLDISPRSFKEVAGRYPTIKEIRTHAKQRSFKKFTVEDQVSDEESIVSEPERTKQNWLHIGKYAIAFAGIVCCFALLWAGMLWILNLPVMAVHQK